MNNKSKQKLTALILILTLITAPLYHLPVSTAEGAAGESSYAVSSNAPNSTGNATGNATGNPEATTAAPVQVQTVVTGLALTHNAKKSTAVTDSITVTPALGRTVTLQLYHSDSKTYSDISQYTMTAADTATVKLSFPAAYRARTTGYWRIVIPSSDAAAAYESPSIKVTTRNLSSKTLVSKSAAIYRVSDGQLIYGKKENTKRRQASTTKVMTALLAMESGKMNKNVKVSRKASLTPYRNMYMIPGDRYNMRQLLYATLCCSSNDGANVLAEAVGGSQSKFVKLMNSRAKTLGMTKTKFKNAHGLDARGAQYTTARDLGVLTAAAYKNKDFRTAISKRSYTIKSKRYKRRTRVYTTDSILGYSSHFKGGKTGYTSKAGKCFTGIYTWKGETYVTVTLGSWLAAYTWSDQKKLHSYIRSCAESVY